jgi:hypothetical protein
MMLFCTTPLIATPCVFGLIYMAPRVPIALTVIFAICALFVLCSLWKTATTNPGLIIRRSENPEAAAAAAAGGGAGSNEEEDDDVVSDVERGNGHKKRAKKKNMKKWSWDDRTQTWRPVTAKFADDCGVLVDEYDHTCPWTGTAIGKGNIFYFYVFTSSLIPLLIFLVICVFVAMSKDKND